LSARAAAVAAAAILALAACDALRKQDQGQAAVPPPAADAAPPPKPPPPPRPPSTLKAKLGGKDFVPKSAFTVGLAEVDGVSSRTVILAERVVTCDGAGGFWSSNEEFKGRHIVASFIKFEPGLETKFEGGTGWSFSFDQPDKFPGSGVGTVKLVERPDAPREAPARVAFDIKEKDGKDFVSGEIDVEWCE
jgi:hypothetical protein